MGNTLDQIQEFLLEYGEVSEVDDGCLLGVKRRGRISVYLHNPLWYARGHSFCKASFQVGYGPVRCTGSMQGDYPTTEQW